MSQPGGSLIDCCNQAITLIDCLVSQEGVQHVDCDTGKNCSGYLKAEPIRLSQHLASPAETGALQEPIRLEDVGYADARKCHENKNQNKT
jgi:hypothetical protein